METYSQKQNPEYRRISDEEFPVFFRFFALIAGVIAFGVVLGSAVRADLQLLPLLFIVFAAPLAVLLVRERRLIVALLCGIIYLNISNTLQSYHGLPSLNKVLIPAILLLLVFITWRERGRHPALIVALAVGVINFTYACGSLLYAEDISLVAESLNRTWKDLSVMLILAGLLWDEVDLRLVSVVIVLCGAFISVLAMMAYYKADPGFIAGGFIRWLPHDIDGTAPSLRISGPVNDPNFFAQILLIPMALSMCFAAWSKSHWLRLCCAVSLVLIVGGLATTLSRGGILAASATLAIFTIWGLRTMRSRLLVVAGVVIASSVGFTIAPSGVQERVFELVNVVSSIFDAHASPDESASGRLHEMLAAIYMFLDHPFFGVGLHNYSVHFQDYSLEHGLMVRGADRAAHSLYLEIAAEQGIFGLTLALLTLFVAFRVAIGAMRRQRRAGNEQAANIIFGIVLAYSAYLMAAVLLHGVHQRFLWLLTGLVLASGNLNVGKINNTDRQGRRVYSPRNR